MSMSPTYRLFAILNNDDRTVVTDGKIYTIWHDAQDAWERHDDSRRDGNREHVIAYGVRESDHRWAQIAVTDPSAFLDDFFGQGMPDALTDREYAEVIGSLQIVRDNARAQGREPQDIISALAKLTNGYTPSTNGMTFTLVQS